MNKRAFTSYFLALCVCTNAFLGGKARALEQQQSKSTKDKSARDYWSDLIWQFLQLTVGAFLDLVNYACSRVTTNVEQSQHQIEGILSQVDDANRQKLCELVENLMTELEDIVASLLRKLGLVLPSLTAAPPQSPDSINTDPNDIIESLLGMSLGDFLLEIHSILDRSINLLIHTIGELINVKESVANPTVKTVLGNVVSSLETANAGMLPIKSNLCELLSLSC